MAKKSVWIDNTVPPTNYIWVKTDSYGEVIGVYQYDGKEWIQLPIGNVNSIEGDGKISAVTLEGETIDINYSIDPLPNNIVIRTDTGTIRTVTPDGKDIREVATVELISWQDV